MQFSKCNKTPLVFWSSPLLCVELHTCANDLLLIKVTFNNTFGRFERKISSDFRKGSHVSLTHVIECFWFYKRITDNEHINISGNIKW